MDGNPYLVVKPPDYATPVLDLFGDKKPQPQKPDQPKPTDPIQPNYFQMMLQKLFAQNQGQPMQLGAPPPSMGSPGGTGGPLGGLY
jgi:hypothetical protein